MWKNTYLDAAACGTIPLMNLSYLDTVFNDMYNTNSGAQNEYNIETATVTSVNMDPVYMDKFSHKLIFQNLATGCCEIDLWTMWPRHDTPVQDDSAVAFPASATNLTWDRSATTGGNTTGANLLYTGMYNAQNSMDYATGVTSITLQSLRSKSLRT